jgi:competence protein ComEC
MKWQWDGVLLEVIHPLSRNQFEGNDASCVVRIEAGGESMLLTGDIEKPAERALLERYSQEFKQKFRQKLNVDGLVVPHHGSNTSSTAEWIDALSPQWGVVPVGYRNRYRLPRADVVERYRAAGVELWSTAEHGAVTIELGQRSKVSGWRSSNLKIWSDSLNLNE